MSRAEGDAAGSFSRRGTAWLVTIAALSLAAAGFLGAFGDALYDPPSFSQDSFSRSAVGHEAFTRLLRSLGFNVVVSRHRTAEKAGTGAVVALLEPRVGPDDEAGRGRLEAIDGASSSLLVVLPKREAIPDPVRPRRVASADLLPPEAAQRVLEALDIGGKVVRPQRSAGSWRGDLPLPTLDAPQLVVSDRLRPLVANDDGILVGELELTGEDDEAEEAEGEAAGGTFQATAGPQSQEPPSWRTIVVADPDLVATHGLGKGENALLLVRILERLGAGERAVLVDETLHGFEQQPSLALELVRFPLLLATLSALLAGGLLAWGALVRFGRPRPPEPQLKPGRLALVESTAGLLRHGGHFAHAAAAYLRAAKQHVTAKHRTSGEGSDDEAWLSRIVEARGRGEALRAIEERVGRLATRRVRGEEEAVRAAQAIHAWREEMTDGAGEDSRDHRAAQG